MANSTYGPKIFKDQNGDRLTVAPGGTLLVEGIVNGPSATGQNFFVSSVSGSSENAGTSPGEAKATLAQAIALCTASRGDRIYLLPGHAEDIITALACSTAGIEIIGLGRGNLIPTISCTHADGTLSISAANVTVRNVRLVANVASGVTSAITITATGDGATLDGVQCRDTTNDKEFLVHVSVATTVTDLLIENCEFVGLIAGSMTNSILFAGTSIDCTIRHNYIFVDSADDTIDHLAGASVNLHVHHNVIINQDTTTALYCFRNKSDGTGCVHDNRCGYNKVDAEMLVGAATWFFENYCSNTIAESGLLDPATAHAIP
jgi:hypothetical protein